ncbi:PREDICTED: uncharacterized protein LOC101314241 [Fragaria vesca subsp. vesca]
MASIFHKLRAAAAPVFANLARRPAAAVLRGDGKERYVLAIKLHPSLNIPPDLVRREFVKQTLDRDLPTVQTTTPDLAGGYVALLFAGLVVCFCSSGWVKEEEASGAGTEELASLVGRLSPSVNEILSQAYLENKIDELLKLLKELEP